MANASATLTDQRLTGWEHFWYVLLCIVYLGWPYLIKLIIKKAQIEAITATALHAEGWSPYLNERLPNLDER